MNRSFAVVALVALIGAVLGHLIGMALQVPFLTHATSLGIPPVPINLLVVELTLGFQVRINLAAAIGMGVALFMILRR